METEPKVQTREKEISVEDVNRVLEVGRLLFSVLTPEEIEALQEWFASQGEMGNAGDS